MKLLGVEMKPYYNGYGEGSEPGIACEVELQVGESYGSRTTIKLPPDHVKQVVALAVELAMTQMAFDPATIRVEPVPGKPRAEQSVDHPETSTNVEAI